MRLLYLMTEPFGIGGVQSDILTLTEDLTKHRHRVYVATMPGVLLEELIGKGAHYVEIDFHYKGVMGFIRAVRALREVIRREEIEVLAPQSVRSTIVAYVGLRLLPFGYRVPRSGKRIPIVTTIHNIHNPRHFQYGGRILNRCSDYVIFESHYERNRLLASGLSESKSSVVHSGIDTDRFKPLPPDRTLAAQYGLELGRHRIFGIVARLSEEKGHTYLLKAFRLVNDKMPETRLLIVGDGPLLKEVREEAIALELNGKAIFTGLQRNVAEHLALIDVFVLASTRESFPLAAREAMAAGKAVIAPRIGGCPEVVDDGHTGYLFESRNVEELARRMMSILGESTDKEFGRRARERVEGLFSRKQWVLGDEAIYRAYL
jgi:glycosyltransferase involved in cell wall biosynthesis